MNKPWKLVLILAGIFILGGITGGLVTMHFGRQWMPRRPGPDQWAPNHLQRLIERLGLSPQQAEQIRPIVKRNMEEMSRLRNETMAEVRRIFERMQREISDKLTPEQRTKFEQMNKEFRERARRFMPDRPNGPSGPGGPHGEHEPPPEKPPGG